VSQFFPFTSWRRHRRTAAPWSVVAYTPSTLGLGVRALLTVGAAVWSLVFGFQTLRPSIGRSDAEHLAAATIVSDPRLAAELGAPLTFKVREIAPRSRLSLDPRSGEFELPSGVARTSVRTWWSTPSRSMDAGWWTRS
jgi:hypothetical protein